MFSLGLLPSVNVENIEFAEVDDELRDYKPTTPTDPEKHRDRLLIDPLASSPQPGNDGRMSIHQGLFDSTLLAALRRWELPITPTQAGRLRTHFEAVVETNRTMNLTRITDPVEAAIKHYADSLALLLWSQDRSIAVRTVLDVGTGAGFPAVPLAIMRPEWEVTAIDATRKKVEFLARTAAAMGMDNLIVEQAHTSHWQSERSFHVVATRALGPLDKCLESCAKFVSPGGWLVAYKTALVPRGEIAAAQKLLKRTRMRVEEPFAYDLQLGDETLHRVLHLFRWSGRTEAVLRLAPGCRLRNTG